MVHALQLFGKWGGGGGELPIRWGSTVLTELLYYGLEYESIKFDSEMKAKRSLKKVGFDLDTFQRSRIWSDFGNCWRWTANVLIVGWKTGTYLIFMLL